MTQTVQARICGILLTLNWCISRDEGTVICCIEKRRVHPLEPRTLDDVRSKCIFMMHSRSQQSAERGTQDEDTIYQENQAYNDYGTLHECIWEQHHQQQQYQAEQQQLQQQQQQHTRVNGATGYSSASPSGQTPTSQPRSSPIAIVRLPGDIPPDPTSHDSDDDDDSVIDVVERDAIRLRKKYGDKVLAASYQPGMAMTDEEPATSTTTLVSSKRMLQAPYLGSLSKSESFLTSLPPISLSEEAMYQYEEPPGEIAGYGSLRESHQRGKFLDGPSSYREPRSGQIRRLDHRVRFPGSGSSMSSSQQHSLSIGERIRQAQKDKESLKQNVKVTTNDSDAAGGTSTLSMMMDEASKNPEPPAVAAAEEGVTVLTSVGHHREMMTALGADDDHAYDKFDPPTMMSTSLTAFEILHSTSRSLTDQRSTQRLAQLRHDQDSSGNYRVPAEAQIREQLFQPLARSLSDPTPRGPLLPPTLQQQPLHSQLGNENLLGTPSTNPYWANPYAVVDPSAQHDPLNSAITGSADPIHNPDTDAAFDMDME